MKIGKRCVFILLSVFLALVLALVLLLWRGVRAAAATTELDTGLYHTVYDGDYKFDAFLSAGGASTDSAVADFVIQDMFHGLVNLNLQGRPFGCSTLASVSPEGDSLFGRNFDWGACTTMIVETAPPDSYASISTVNMDFLNVGLPALSEDMRVRLLAAAAPYAPMDGMNEMGLCVAVLMIEDRPGFDQQTEKPDLTTTTAVRLLLDKAASVEEAVSLLSDYDMHASMGMMVHFAIADRNGQSSVVEYVNNEMVVTQTPVVTNFYLANGEKYGVGSSESHVRYDMLMDLISQNTALTMEDMRDALDSVSKHNFNSSFASTEWSTVYNQQCGEVRYYHREDFSKAYTFQLSGER